MADNKKLIEFNIKNAKYYIPNKTESPVPFGYSDSLALEADYSEKVIYGDGIKIATLPNDKGKTGTLSLLAIDEAYEIAMKRRMKISTGTVEIKQTSAVEHHLYFETEYMEGGTVKTAKTWVYGVTSGRPSQTYNQTTDDINNNNISYSISIKGTPVISGGKPYIDNEGNAVYAWQQTAIPGDANYDTFGTTFVPPTVSAE